MPTYEYACTTCAEQVEVVQRFSDDPLTVCPACGGTLRKVFSPVGIVFKGSGFYRTDSRQAAGAAGKAGPGANGDGAKDGSSKDGSPKDGSSKDGSPKDGSSKDGKAKEPGSGSAGSGAKKPADAKPSRSVAASSSSH